MNDAGVSRKIDDQRFIPKGRSNKSNDWFAVAIERLVSLDTYGVAIPKPYVLFFRSLAPAGVDGGNDQIYFRFVSQLARQTDAADFCQAVAVGANADQFAVVPRS